MSETKPPSGINPWAVATTVSSSLLLALIFGFFTMYADNQRQNENDINQKAEIAALKAAQAESDKTFRDFKESTNIRFNTVDNLKQSFDNLNRYAAERR